LFRESQNCWWSSSLCFRILLPSLSYAGTVCLGFYYHMWGFHMGSLEVYISRDGILLQTLWSLSGNQDNFWLENKLTVTILQSRDKVELNLKYCRYKWQWFFQYFVYLFSSHLPLFIQMVRCLRIRGINGDWDVCRSLTKR